MKSLKFRHPFARKFKSAISEQRALEILPLVKEGHDFAIKELIEGHIQYACSVVGSYLLSVNSNITADDLTGAAFFGLVKGVDSIRRNGLAHNNITGYLARHINGEIKKILKSEKFLNLTNVELWTKPDNSLEVEEDVKTLINDETDECIIGLLRLGYSPIDIGRELNIHRSNISRRIGRIQNSYKELQNG
jgi:DNA-directed RNA polymerase specialized sigma subunit